MGLCAKPVAMALIRALRNIVSAAKWMFAPAHFRTGYHCPGESMEHDSEEIVIVVARPVAFDPDDRQDRWCVDLLPTPHLPDDHLEPESQ